MTVRGGVEARCTVRDSGGRYDAVVYPHRHSRESGNPEAYGPAGARFGVCPGRYPLDRGLGGLQAAAEECGLLLAVDLDTVAAGFYYEEAVVGVYRYRYCAPE